MFSKCLVSLILVTQLLSQISFAQSHRDRHDIDWLIASDREGRIARINELSMQLNQSLVELERFKNELTKAEKADGNSTTAKIRIRNAASVVAALGFISSIIYQSKGINPSKVILAGGYAVSTIAAIVTVLEQRSISLSKEELEKLKRSVSDLEKKVLIEQSNLKKEIRLLCLSDGGTAEQCDRND